MTHRVVLLSWMVFSSFWGCSTGINSESNMVTKINQTPTSFYDIRVLAANGKDTLKMSDYKGYKVLIVNVASECGYTPQYRDLQSLYDLYKGKLVIIGFPCNQFGGQEPGSDEEIVQFCQKNYGVTFPITQKGDVRGTNQHELYQWLTQKSLNNKEDYSVKWNFNKFLISESGQLEAYFSSSVKPLSEELQNYLK